MYLADVARRVILVVLFDNRTTLGLVRLKMKLAVEELTKLFEQVFTRGRADGGCSRAQSPGRRGRRDRQDCSSRPERAQSCR